MSGELVTRCLALSFGPEMEILPPGAWSSIRISPNKAPRPVLIQVVGSGLPERLHPRGRAALGVHGLGECAKLAMPASCNWDAAEPLGAKPGVEASGLRDGRLRTVVRFLG